jgi:TonB-dependent receptor
MNRGRLLGLVRKYGAIFAAMLAFQSAAYAEPQTRSYSIPSQELVSALEAYARVSGEQLAFDASKLAGKKSHTLVGAYSAGQALNQLLVGTDTKQLVLNGGVRAILPTSTSAKVEATALPVPLPATPPEATVLVTGIRASLRSAVTNKRASMEVSDSIIAEDIGKLPDSNLAEAMQRVPGVQITRDMGEGDGIAIRGLTQAEMLLNGREIFSDTQRDLSLGSIASDIFAGVEIIKTPSAELVEGGLAGIVSLRTREPFDFEGPLSNLNIKETYYDMAGEERAQLSGLWSTRAKTRTGEWGVLINIARIGSTARLDTVGVEPFDSRYNLVDRDHNGVFPGTSPPAPGADAGDEVIAPHGGGNSIGIVNRERRAFGLVGQWRGNSGRALKFEFNRFNLTSHQDAAVIYANDGPMSAAPGAIFTFAGATDVLASGAYSDVIVTVPDNYFDQKSQVDQMALSGKWTFDDASTISFDLSATNSRQQQFYGGLRVGTTQSFAGSRFDFDLRGSLPSLSLNGMDFSDPNAYRLQDASNWMLRNDSGLLAAQADAHLNVDRSIVDTVNFGVRQTRRETRSQQGGQSHLVAETSIVALPEAASAMPFHDFFGDTGHGELFGLGILGAPFSLVRDTARICQALGDTKCQPQFDPLKTYDAVEVTSAIYLQVNFTFPLDDMIATGNLGARYVATDLDIDGFRTSGSSSLPLHSHTRYANFMPSLNMKLEMRPGLYLRLAAANQITRPNFDILSPDLTIGFTGTNTSLLGHAGNPNLGPMTSSSYDLALEYYHTRNSLGFFTLFSKRVEGFVETVVKAEPINFPDYPSYSSLEVARPQSGGVGHIRGVEVGFQTFFDFLPAPLNGLGLQANYTFVHANAPGPLAGTLVPLLGLSRNSANLIVYYESKAYHARVAYNYRDNYVETTSGTGSGFLPIYEKPYGVLDASVGYSFSKGTDLSIEIGNILKRSYQSYFSVADKPRFYNIYDRRFSLVLRLRR